MLAVGAPSLMFILSLIIDFVLMSFYPCSIGASLGGGVSGFSKLTKKTFETLEN